MSEYKVPSWAGTPPAGFHLDVTKEGKLIQKLMIDQKGCYLFGRNSQLSDFTVDHNSCSRVHAALVYHKYLARYFLVDCGSTHGTFIGNIRLENQKPTQLAGDMNFRFGASTRSFQIRERPQTGTNQGLQKSCIDYSNIISSSSYNHSLLSLPKSDLELDNLTEFNTARNRQTTILEITHCDRSGPSNKRRKIRVEFKDTEDVINPEDIDPSIGKFQNIIKTKFIPNKNVYYDDHYQVITTFGTESLNSAQSYLSIPRGANYAVDQTQIFKTTKGLYDGIESYSPATGPSLSTSSLSTKLGFSLPNPAPHVEIKESIEEVSEEINIEEPKDSKKKKYPIEAWPGRHPCRQL